MFAAGLLFLLCLAGWLHFGDESALQVPKRCCAWGLVLLYPLFVIEFLIHVVQHDGRWPGDLLCCLFPPLRIAAREHATGRATWLPRAGWVVTDAALCRRLERVFSVPMILTALCVVPLMVCEVVFRSSLASRPVLQFALAASTALVWFAFTLEFVLMISLVEHKFRYCKQNWIDIAVICLPLLAILRTARLGRLGRLLKVQNLAGTARVYWLRGAVMRVYRAILVLEIFQRVFRQSTEQRLALLKQRLSEKETELDDLRNKIRRLERTTEAAPKAAPPATRKNAPRPSTDSPARWVRRPGLATANATPANAND
jgi:voltage-gated potassium channel